jgi:hypothetical protein
MDVARLLGVICILGSIVTIASVLVVFPQKTVCLQARLMRYQLRLFSRMSDEEMDKMVSLPGTRNLIGSPSQFVNRGEQHPEEFPNLQRYHQTFGFVIWGMIILTVLLFLVSTPVEK